MNLVNGDLIKLAKQGKFDVIAHGCNCQSNMGAGIAKQIAKAFPEAKKCDLTFASHMGDISYTSHNRLIIVNCYTQIWYGKPNNRYGIKDTAEGRYEAIRSCMKRINTEFKGKHIGLPKIGCGLAGLNWDIVKEIIREKLVDCEVTVIIYNK